MTAREKALWLIAEIRYALSFPNSPLGEHKDVAAKACALICVEEAMKNFEGLHKPEYCAFDAIGERRFTFEGEHPEHMTGYDMIEYWTAVKSEITKL